MLWNDARYQLLQHPIGDWLEREFPGRQLFLYRHRVHETWVVAQWVKGRPHVFREVLVIGTAPEDFTHVLAEALRQMLNTPSAVVREELKAELTADERAYERRQADEDEEFEDAHRFFHSRIRSNVKRDDPLIRVMAGLPDM